MMGISDFHISMHRGDTCTFSKTEELLDTNQVFPMSNININISIYGGNTSNFSKT